MYLHEHDQHSHTYVARFAPGGDMQADFAAHFRELDKALALARTDGVVLALLILFEAGHEVPDAHSRAMVAEYQSRDIFTANLVIVSRNPLLRGVLTALEWIRGRKIKMQTASSVDEATAMLERARGCPIPSLRLAAARVSQSNAA